MRTDQYRKPEAITPAPEPIIGRYKTFSPNQWTLVRDLQKRGFISHDDAPYYDQGTMNSFVRRGFLVIVKEGYALSDMGHRAIYEHNHAEIKKEHPSANLGQWVRTLQTVRALQRIK